MVSLQTFASGSVDTVNSLHMSMPGRKEGGHMMEFCELFSYLLDPKGHLQWDLYIHNTVVYSQYSEIQWYTHNTAVHSQYSDTLTIQQYTHNTVIHSQYSGTLTIQQYTHNYNEAKGIITHIPHVNARVILPLENKYPV